MPTSATGPSERGFTLIELLVVMVILATLAGAISLTLPDERLARQQAAVESWQRQALWAADASLWQGRPTAWQIAEGSAQVLQQRDSQWAMTAAAEGRPQALMEGMRVAAVESEGRLLDPGERIVFRGGEIPFFSVRVESELGVWRISGNPGGRIEWERLPSREQP